ncbi:MAG: transcription elongation factor GreA [Anaerolineales bacterium]|nr:transcription elongation factor GreA [Anaerolineales bacterium]
MNQTFLTPEGADKLRAELQELTTTKRQELSKRLREAIQMGDLSENADYIMAKEDQAFLEGKIQEIEATLRSATIVNNANQGVGAAEIVAVGCTVTVQERGEQAEKYMLVGAKEANPRERKISNESPIGRALLGRKVGEEVRAATPGGTLVLTIVAVEYA